MEIEQKYYGFQDILNFLGVPREFEISKHYPFNRNPEDILFSWGQILIPEKVSRKWLQTKFQITQNSLLKISI